MAGYTGRKPGVNVSRYVADLNKVPSDFEVARSGEEEFNYDEELAQFTNAEFLDFDAGNFLNENGLGFDENAADQVKAEKAQPVEGANNGLGFGQGEFALPTGGPYDINALPQGQSQQALFEFSQNPSQHGLPPYPTSSAAPVTPTYPTYPPAPKHMSHPASASHASPTDSSSGDPARALAEEDKRRRNTAASARFRVKKKQREQALEKKTEELEKHKQSLEQRIGQLETENAWLRGLVTEKNGKGTGERSPEGGKKGVGTDEIKA